MAYLTGDEFEERKRKALADVQKYSAPTLGPAEQAEVVKANAITREVSPEETSQFQLEKMLASDSALMKRAETQGLMQGAKRGLLNSSLAVGAAQGAMIDRAQPFAINDAATYFNTAESNMRAQNQAELANAQMATETNIFNTGQRNTFTTTQAGLDAQAAAANAAAANSALNAFLDRENSIFMMESNQAFQAAENAADRNLRQTLQDEALAATASENALDRANAITMQSNQFAQDELLQSNLFNQQTALQAADFANANAMQQAGFAQDQLMQSNLFNQQNAMQAADIANAQAMQQAGFANDQAMQQSLFAQQNAQQAADQAFQLSYQANAQTFEQSMQQANFAQQQALEENRQSFEEAQNALDRELTTHQINQQTAGAIMIGTMETVGNIYADPNLTATQKQGAVQNALNTAASMPELLNVIAGNTSAGQNTGGDDSGGGNTQGPDPDTNTSGGNDTWNPGGNSDVNPGNINLGGGPFNVNLTQEQIDAMREYYGEGGGGRP